MATNDDTTDGGKQTYIPNKGGYINRSTGTWHYLKRCAGDLAMKKPLQEAKNDGDNLCGVCCSRFYWYDKSDE